MFAFLGTSCSAYSLHPGAVRSEITRLSAHGIFKILPILKHVFYPFWYFISKSCKEGAQTTIFCAVTHEARQYAGCYFRFVF